MKEENPPNEFKNKEFSFDTQYGNEQCLTIDFQCVSAKFLFVEVSRLELEMIEPKSIVLPITPHFNCMQI